VTVGVFDGVHRGHQAVIGQLVVWAREGGVDPVVVTLWPHPKQVVTGEAPPLVTSLEHRLVLLERAGVIPVVLPFDREVAGLSAEAFVERLLARGLGASRVLVGPDHRFGRERQGDLELLERLGAAHGFEARAARLDRLEAVGPDGVGGDVSSTRVRAALSAGDLPFAEALLGRPVSVLGPIVRGDARGRTLGFPTANLDLGPALRPPRGVWAVRARLLGDDGTPGPWRPAVANVGRRPTFHKDAPDLMEVHLLDAAPSPHGSGAGGAAIAPDALYGQRLEAELVAKLRDERRFSGPDALRTQIAADCAAARAALAER
jgi:riboflavin kinase/FMN adenylyltransferase